MTTSRHVSIEIAADARTVYEFAVEPANLPRWAAGLARSEMEQIEGRWFARSPMGRVAVSFVPANDFGVLDHTVTLPDGTAVYNPMRVIANGAVCEVVFTLRPRPGMDDADLEADADAVSTDLATLRDLLEGRDSSRPHGHGHE